MKPINFHRIFVTAMVVSLAASYIGIWARMITDPVQRTGSDFIAFYSAGRVSQNNGAAHVYEPILQQKIQEEQVGFPLVTGQVLLYNHIPYLIPILHAIVSTDYIASFYRWVIILVALYITSITVLSYLLKDAGLNSSSVLLTGVGSFLFLPLFFSLMNGQDTAFLFLGTAIWMYGLISGKETLAGLGLSLTTVRPHIALILALPMFLRYRKVFWVFVLGSTILAILSFAILGISGSREFMNILLISSGGEWYGMKEYAMYNLIGLLTRLSPWLGAGTIRTIGWSFYVITIIVLSFLWADKKESNEGRIELTMILALFSVPHLHLHDLALLLIPIYNLIRSSKQADDLKTSIAIVLPIAISMLFLISNASYFLQYAVPYLIMLILAAYPYFSKYKTGITAPRLS